MAADTAPIARAIRAQALHLGFDRVGYCEGRLPPEARHLERWLAAGMHGEMSWIQRGRERRLDPARVLPGVRSLIVVAISYASPRLEEPQIPLAPTRGRVARYALGQDYHRVAGDRLLALEEFIESAAPPHRAMAYVDTGPVLERMWAGRAGIGWVGKHSLVLNKEMGSYFFLGVVLTTLELPPDPPATDQCGSCTLCIEACPTAAIVEPRMVDSRRCISYHTIELRGPIPPEHREAIGTRVFGCDDCQEACPWNRQLEGPAAGSAFPVRPGSASPSLLELLIMTRDDYLDRFRGSAIKRATYDGLRRNAAVALGNLKVESLPALEADSIVGALDRVASSDRESQVLREQSARSAERIRRRLDAAGGADA